MLEGIALLFTLILACGIIGVTVGLIFIIMVLIFEWYRERLDKK